MAEGVRRIGAERAAVASTLGPPAAAIMAVSVLGEQVGAGQAMGIALILGGILTLELKSRASPANEPAN
ncbi:MAG: EamA family transporter [Gammaproteobacteria bacterium]|nr:EamA family transporter [Gammaproteobacteria bacterium]